MGGGRLLLFRKCLILGLWWLRSSKKSDEVLDEIEYSE